MPATTKVPLGGSVLARRWYLDVNTGTHASPTWTGVFGIEDLKLAMDPTVQGDSDYDSEGYKSSTISALGWSVTGKLARKVRADLATAYSPGQEALRAVAKNMGAANRAEIRIYEMEEDGPRTEAYDGYVTVAWSEDGGSQEALATISITLTGQGKLNSITHPDGAAAKPVLYSVTPDTADTAGGSLHRLVGTGFFADGEDDVVSMKIGVTDIPVFTTLSDNEIVWVSPAKVAGPFVVYVTNAEGESVTATVTVTYA